MNGSRGASEEAGGLNAMRRLTLFGLLVAIGVALSPAIAMAWSGSSPFARAEVGPGSARYGSPFPGPPLGELQNEAWGRYLWGQYLRNSGPPRPMNPQRPGWAWVAPAWQWDGFRWVWVPGYWVPVR